jgi:hypothetical protein
MNKNDESAQIDAQQLLSEITKIQAICNHLEDLMRILAEPVLEVSLGHIFSNDLKQLRAYELTDGNNSTRDIGALVGVDQKTISTWWRKWAAGYHIVEKFGRRGQFRKRYSLLELMVRHGKPVAQPPATEKEN